jgi:CCR4-NOT transcriptional regulation complex NOT5 subunit
MSTQILSEGNSKNNNSSSNTSSTSNLNSIINSGLDFSKFQPFVDEVKNQNFEFEDMLATSSKFMISPEETNYYIPQSIISFKTTFPSVQPILNIELFEKFDECTLMFIFFYQNNPQAKYNAGKVLTKRGWMYSKKFFTWFEPQKPIKSQTDEYIEAKFKYFDFEKDFGSATKKDFKFDLKLWEKFE